MRARLLRPPEHQRSGVDSRSSFLPVSPVDITQDEDAFNEPAAIHLYENIKRRYGDRSSSRAPEAIL